MKHSKIRTILGSASVSAIVLTMLPLAAAQAQEADQTASREGRGVDVITVTARRKEENVQSVPVTVTALPGDELKTRNILAPSDLQFAAPSVTVQAELGRLGGTFTVRGLNAGTVTYFAEAPGGPTAIGMPFFDEASVQVLNGPQGTLFGRTAAAGAVLVTPRRPDLDGFGGYADVSVGDYGRLQATAALNLPLIENELAIRAVYHREHIDGFTEQFRPSVIVNGLPGVVDPSKNLDEVDNQSIRLSAEWNRGAFKNYAVYSYLNIDQTGPGHILAYANPALANLNRNASFFAGQSYCTSTADPAACGAYRAATMAQVKSLVQTELARSQAGGSVRMTP
ncbi:MAG: TonB-dependent receptor plug domain-containing protein, partial [Amphiplicatus sp.]